MAFATTDDVATRLGRVLSDAEEATAELYTEVVTGLILTAVGRDSDWADDLDPVPALLRVLCIEKVVGAITNPNNVASYSEQLGQYQHSATFPRASDIGVFLTDEEERKARFAVYGTGTGSVMLGSAFQEVES